MVQSIVVWVGLAGGLIVCIWGCSRGTLTVGDTVLFITMMQQLYVPLTYFGSYYRQVGLVFLRCRMFLVENIRLMFGVCWQRGIAAWSHGGLGTQQRQTDSGEAVLTMMVMQQLYR